MGVKAKGGRARVGGFGLLSPVRSFPSNAVLQGSSGLTNASAWRCYQNNGTHSHPKSAQTTERASHNRSYITVIQYRSTEPQLRIPRITPT